MKAHWRARLRILNLCGVGIFLIPLFTLAQDAPAPFELKVDTRLVVQTVSVTDKDGRPIEGLTANDFVLTEDGIAQPITVFDFEKLDDAIVPATDVPAPVARAPERPLVPDRITPVPPGDNRYQDRRLLALYFDMPSMGDADRFRALAAAQTFIEKQISAADLVAIFTFSDGAVRVRNDFTANR